MKRFSKDQLNDFKIKLDAYLNEYCHLVDDIREYHQILDAIGHIDIKDEDIRRNELLKNIVNRAYIFTIICIDNFLEYFKSNGELSKLFEANVNIFNFFNTTKNKYFDFLIKNSTDLYVVDHKESLKKEYLRTKFDMSEFVILGNEDNSAYKKFKNSFPVIVKLRNIYSHYNRDSKNKFYKMNSDPEALKTLLGELEIFEKRFKDFFENIYFQIFFVNIDINSNIDMDTTQDIVHLYENNSIEMLLLNYFYENGQWPNDHNLVVEFRKKINQK